MASVYLGLGSNLGDGRLNILAAWKLLDREPGIRCRKLSSPYLSEPVGLETEFWFTNAVGLIETSLEPRALLMRLLAIEAEMGRERGLTRDRPIDLDILYYGELVLEEPDLVLPHPRLHERLFVLAPLNEIAPDRVHPLLKQTTGEMLSAVKLEASQAIEKISWSNT